MDIIAVFLEKDLWICVGIFRLENQMILFRMLLPSSTFMVMPDSILIRPDSSARYLQYALSLLHRINSKLAFSKLLFSAIEDIVSIEQDNVLVDEYCTSFKDLGLLRATKLKDIITGHKDTQISTKETMLPLQGDRLWKAWAVHDKELHRQVQRGKDNVEDYADKINNEKATIRTERCQFSYSCNGVFHYVDIKSWR